MTISISQLTPPQMLVTKSYCESYGKECERRLASAKGMDRVLLNYYRANTYPDIIEAKRNDENYTWSWEQSDGVQDVLALRRAIIEPAFKTCPSIRIGQMRTNLANRLSTLGRPVAANEQWLKMLEVVPSFAKALAARGDSSFCTDSVEEKP